MIVGRRLALPGNRASVASGAGGHQTSTLRPDPRTGAGRDRREVAAIDVLDPSAVRRWCAAAVAALEACRAEIDDLNVFPVPDGDTGTNMLLTLRAADEAVRSDPPGDLVVTVTSMARGAVLGARGNSGVIVSQVLRGLAEGLAAGPGGGGRAVAAALDRGADLAWASVGDPVEGTMLSWSAAPPTRRPPPARSWPPWSARRCAGRRRRWRGPRRSCRCSPRRAWWTPAAGACWCCWRRSPGWWPRRRPARCRWSARSATAGAWRRSGRAARTRTTTRCSTC